VDVLGILRLTDLNAALNVLEARHIIDGGPLFLCAPLLHPAAEPSVPARTEVGASYWGHIIGSRLKREKQRTLLFSFKHSSCIHHDRKK
jgi:hypothetical protein